MALTVKLVSPRPSPKKHRKKNSAAAVKQKAKAPTDKYPLGATLLRSGKGVAFSVWAPNADTVSVIGEFNSWNADAHPLVRHESGVWGGVVLAAREGHEYRYALQCGDSKFTRVDPRAIKVTNSVGNGIV